MVQLYVSQLRKTLANGGDGGEIVTRGRGYELRLGSGGVDARRFEQLIDGRNAARRAALWRGAPLVDVAEEPFAARRDPPAGGPAPARDRAGRRQRSGGRPAPARSSESSRRWSVEEPLARAAARAADARPLSLRPAGRCARRLPGRARRARRRDRGRAGPELRASPRGDPAPGPRARATRRAHRRAAAGARHRHAAARPRARARRAARALAAGARRGRPARAPGRRRAPASARRAWRPSWPPSCIATGRRCSTPPARAHPQRRGAVLGSACTRPGARRWWSSTTSTVRRRGSPLRARRACRRAGGAAAARRRDRQTRAAMQSTRMRALTLAPARCG